MTNAGGHHPWTFWISFRLWTTGSSSCLRPAAPIITSGIEENDGDFGVFLSLLIPVCRDALGLCSWHILLYCSYSSLSFLMGRKSKSLSYCLNIEINVGTSTETDGEFFYVDDLTEDSPRFLVHNPRGQDRGLEIRLAVMVNPCGFYM